MSNDTEKGAHWLNTAIRAHNAKLVAGGKKLPQPKSVGEAMEHHNIKLTAAKMRKPKMPKTGSWTTARGDRVTVNRYGTSVSQKPKTPKMGAKKSMQSTPNHEESFMSFEEIFKSEHEETCESCGQAIEKGMKHKKGKKHGTAHKIGNEMDPHRGKPSGSVFVGPSRGGYKAGAVDREHSKKPHAPASGIVKALFPVSAAPQLAVYDGLGDDAALAQNIEASLTPGMAHNLFVPSARNLAVENEQGLAQDE